MKKVILKSTLAVVAVTASCLGAWKAYEAYENVDNDLLMENLEALSQDGDNGSGGVDTQYCCKDVTTKKKLARESSSMCTWNDFVYTRTVWTWSS